MADESSDVDRLMQCLARGMAQRRQHPHRVNSVPSTPTKLASPSCANVASLGAASSEVDVRTPQTAVFHTPIRTNVTSLREDEGVSTGSGSKQISPGVFYGSPLGKPSNKPLHVLRLLSEIRNDLAGQSYSRDVESAGTFKLVSATRDAIWATFPKQEQAIQFAESNVDNEIAVFQYQDHMSGQRRFLATTYTEFWQRYRTMRSDHRHHYEIIQEGKPCHLYFDLEFNCKANAEADGEAMVDILLALVQKVFLEIYGLQYEPSWTIELDSSTTDCRSFPMSFFVPRTTVQGNMDYRSMDFVSFIGMRSSDMRSSLTNLKVLMLIQPKKFWFPINIHKSGCAPGV